MQSEKKHFLNQCFTSLYYLTKDDIKKVSKEIEAIFPTLISTNPAKALTILSFFCVQDWDSRDFWEIVLNLVKLIRVFVTNRSCGSKYVQFMGFLLETDQELGRAFIDHHLKKYVLASLSLKIPDDNVIRQLYQLLMLIEAKIKEFEIIEEDDDDNKPEDAVIANHLEKKSIQNDVISYLLTCNIPLGVKTIETLSKIKSKNAGYVLLNFALCPIDHSSLTESLLWIESKRISPEIQIRLFLAVLKDKSTRPSLSQSSQVLNFLCRLIETNNKEIYKMLSTCVRRLVNENSLEHFQSCHFFKKYWTSVMEMNESGVVDASIMCIDKLAETGYIADLNDVIPTLKQVINSYQQSAEQAIKILATCSQYPECRDALLKYRKYFAKLRETNDFDEECGQFEQNIH